MNEAIDQPTVAFLPLARTTFDMKLAGQVVARARAALEAAGLKIQGPATAITDADAAENALRGLKVDEIDVVVFLQATFADSQIVRKFADRIDAPLLLWAVPEEPAGGRLRLNSYCGVNLAAHALTRAGRRYESVYAAAEDEDVVRRIQDTAVAGRVERGLRRLRIGRLGPNPDGFDSCTFDAGTLREKLGVEVVALDQPEFFASVQKADAPDVSELKESLRQQVAGLDDVEAEPTDNTLRSYLVLESMAKQQGLGGLAVRCWPEFFTEMGCAACGALSLLSDRGIPAGCESDIHGVVTQWILQTVAGAPAFDTDIVAFDEAADAVVFWHCGKAPLSLADFEETPRATIHSNRQLPLLWEFPLKPGTVTLARLGAVNGGFRLTLAKGEMLRAPKSFTGTSGRCRFGRPAREFMESILEAGLEHHLTLVYGDHLSTLKTLAQRLDLPVLEL